MDIFSTRDENLSSTLQDDVLSRDSRYKQAFKNLNATLETREKAYRRKIGALAESLEVYADKLEVLQKRFESYLEVEAHRKAEIKRLKSLHQQILSSLQNSQWLGYYLDPGEGTLDFADSHMFDAGNRELSVESKQTLSSHYTVLIKEMMKVQDARKYLKAIVVEGHTDSSGTAVQNQRISRERAEVVKDLFASLEITAQYQLAPLLIAKGMSNRFPMMKNGKEDQSASRRIKIKFDLDTIQIEKEIDRLLND
ncbi:MAG TPA: hypothetical protein ENK71_01740 [Epsilonproteobacteria bacterium]|nr:hypothetical protein [Campylobacterota bacterium]